LILLKKNKTRAATRVQVKHIYRNFITKRERGTISNKTIEKHIENQIKRYLDQLGVWYMKVHGSMYQKAGVPDILVCLDGRFVGIEVKRPGGVVSSLQKFNIDDIHRSGGAAFVAYSVDDVRKQFDALRISKENH
jgi:RecB family endonuclease NucS